MTAQNIFCFTQISQSQRTVEVNRLDGQPIISSITHCEKIINECHWSIIMLGYFDNFCFFRMDVFLYFYENIDFFKFILRLRFFYVLNFLFEYDCQILDKSSGIKFGLNWSSAETGPRFRFICNLTRSGP